MKNRILILFIIILTLTFVSIAIFFVSEIIFSNNQIKGRCGDGICDEKEKANPKLCPEDCEKTDDNGDINDYEDSPFGYLSSPELTTYYEDLGVKWTRVAAQWGLLQTPKNFEENVYDWDYWEERVDWDELKNMNVLITISFLATPIEETGSYVPSQYPYNKENYLKYVEALVNRYKSQTKYFQVENEPPKGLEDFAELQKITYNKIKEVCPECIVVIGGYAKTVSYERLFNKDMLPILSELDGKYIDIFDIHWFGTKHDSNVMDPLRLSSDKMDINLVREKLQNYGYDDIDIWITESGTYSGLPIRHDFQTEKEQASSVIKRYISPIAQGVDKVMWAWGVKESFKKDCRFFDYTGLIYDGCDCENEEYVCGNNIEYDLRKDVKKLGYYTYKKMTETLEGSDWDKVETIQESNDIYVYKFTNKETNEPTWVAWSDSGSGSVSLSSLGISKAKVIEAVPNYENGLEIEDSGVAFEDMFKESVVSGSVALGDVPVFIKRVEGENSLTSILNLKYSSVDSDSVKLDLYFPEKTCNGKLPLVIMIHGGAFKAGNKYPVETSFLTDNCYAVASINYRLSDEAIFPAGNQDVKSAVRWLRANAEKYNLDSEHFGVMGTSAGGYYSSFLGTTGDIKDFDTGDNLEYSSVVQAVVNQYGIADFSTLAQDRVDAELSGNRVESIYLGCDIGSADCANVIKASPINYISKEDPPFLILHGEKDSVIPIKQSQKFYKKLQDTGVPATFISLPNAKHGGREFDNYKLQMLSFFDKYLKEYKKVNTD